MTTVEPSKPSSAPTPSKLYPSPITTTYAARTFSFITSIAATPIASSFGLVSAAALGISAIAAQVLSKIKEEKSTGALSESHKVVKQENIPFADKKKNMTLAERLTHNARVAILATVPFIGIQLADYYNRTGKIQGFEKHAIFEAALQDLGADPRRMIFNDASRMKKDPKKSWGIEALTGLPSPPPAETIKKRAQIWGAELVEQHLPIEGENRTTDVTLIKDKSAKDDAPTVLYYHGNAASRYHNEEIKEYLDKGLFYCTCELVILFLYFIYDISSLFV